MDTLFTVAAKDSTVPGVKARANTSPGTAQLVVTIMEELDWIGTAESSQS